MPQADPIRERYYRSVEIADRITDYSFYLGAILSIVMLLISPATYPVGYVVTLTAFVLVVILLFFVSLATRLYLTPRAEHRRRQDFLTSAFGVSLTHENTVGYYNNDFVDAPKRLAAQVLENSFFTKSLATAMARNERGKTIGYFIVWVILVLNRHTDFGVILAASQAIFSEQLLSKTIRLDWLRSKSEKVHEDVYRLFQSNPTNGGFLPMSLDSLLLYESAKSNASIVIPSKLFERMNPELTRQWNEIRQKLHI